MQKKDITFKPFVLYSQKQNGVFEQIRKTIMNMTKTTILEENIDNDL